jgi:cell wall-associated NlpC family hydrolase
MPLTPEQVRIQKLFAGDPLANRQLPQEEGTAPVYSPQDYQQPDAAPARSELGYRNAGYDPNANDPYGQAIQNRLGQISGMGTAATERAQAAAVAKAQAAQAAAIAAANAQGTNDYSGGGAAIPDNLPQGARGTILRAAAGAVGLPYAWGGGTKKGASYGIGRGTSNLKGFDCSGLVLYAYSKIGINMSHSANAQARMGVRMPINRLSPGDLVGHPGHIAIYAGNGMMYEAPTFGKRVRLVPVRKGMFGVHFKL